MASYGVAQRFGRSHQKANAAIDVSHHQREPVEVAMWMQRTEELFNDERRLLLSDRTGFELQ